MNGLSAFPARPVTGHLVGVVPSENSQQDHDPDGDRCCGNQEADEGFVPAPQRQAQTKAGHLADRRRLAGYGKAVTDQHLTIGVGRYAARRE